MAALRPSIEVLKENPKLLITSSQCLKLATRGRHVPAFIKAHCDADTLNLRLNSSLCVFQRFWIKTHISFDSNKLTIHEMCVLMDFSLLCFISLDHLSAVLWTCCSLDHVSPGRAAGSHPGPAASLSQGLREKQTSCWARAHTYDSFSQTSQQFSAARAPCWTVDPYCCEATVQTTHVMWLMLPYICVDLIKSFIVMISIIIFLTMWPQYLLDLVVLHQFSVISNWAHVCPCLCLFFETTGNHKMKVADVSTVPCGGFLLTARSVGRISNSSVMLAAGSSVRGPWTL